MRCVDVVLVSRQSYHFKTCAGKYAYKESRYTYQTPLHDGLLLPAVIPEVNTLKCIYRCCSLTHTVAYCIWQVRIMARSMLSLTSEPLYSHVVGDFPCSSTRVYACVV
ncbi:hypothetical protein FKM82_009094 [Ascaphus truei]